jgi:hypothetical protein
MKELLPLCAGLGVGWLSAFIPHSRLRLAALPLACLAVGVLVSWVKGELSGDLWPLFVSFDSLVVSVTAALTLVVLSLGRRATG